VDCLFPAVSGAASHTHALTIHTLEHASDWLNHKFDTKHIKFVDKPKNNFIAVD
jgi:hypothetical protein